MPVYMIQAGENGPVKIGKADNILGRLRTLQTGHYEILHVLRTFDGGPPTEDDLQEKFRRYHIRNEWYRYHPEMLSYEPPPELGPTPEEIAAYRAEAEATYERIRHIVVR